MQPRANPTMNSNPDIHFDMRGDIAVVTLTRPTNRNALNDALIASLRHIFENLPDNT
jgi:enoyl-CoA hydratase/carnithine racemase